MNGYIQNRLRLDTKVKLISKSVGEPAQGALRCVVADVLEYADGKDDILKPLEQRLLMACERLAKENGLENVYVMRVEE